MVVFSCLPSFSQKLINLLIFNHKNDGFFPQLVTQCHVLSDKQFLFMLISVALFLMLQLIGEALSYGFGWPIPGPVLGMIFLLIGFVIKDDLIERVRLTASVLLAHLALLFVPAGVGIVRHWERISAEWMAIAAILVIGTAITMVVTALVVQWSAKILGVDDDD